MVTNSLVLGDNICNTTQSKVDKATWERDGQKETVILKVPRPGSTATGEYRVLQKLNHPNIVRLIGVLAEDKHSMVLEYMPCGDLQHFLKINNQPGSAASQAGMRRNIIVGVINALIYIHSMGYVHRDVKCANIFLRADYTAILGDFGLARKMDKNTHRYVSTYVPAGTYGHIAPEVINAPGLNKRCAYDEKTDMFAMGVLILFVGSNNMPEFIYPGARNREDRQAANEANQMPMISPEVSEATRKMFLLCFNENPSERPSAEDLLLEYQKMECGI